jgi:Holliday junction resolvase RusA-like endonuclease
VIRFTIPGEPRTKKNGNRIVQKNGKPFLLPSQQFLDYQEYAGWFVPQEKIDKPINLKVLYYMGSHRRVDLVNLLEATCDILVKYQCIEDDSYKYIRGHDGSRVLYDKEHPRAEVIIEEWRE